MLDLSGAPVLDISKYDTSRFWRVQQSTGNLSICKNVVDNWHDEDVENIWKETCYSGFHEGKNNPEMQSVKDVGPIPQGLWMLTGLAFVSPEHGQYCMHLTPFKNTVTFGRDGFLWHGDSWKHPGEASKGCIISMLPIRLMVFKSPYKIVEVIA